MKIPHIGDFSSRAGSLITRHNQFKREEMIMEKYVCDVCGYVYDPEVGDPDNGIEPGTSFADLPEEWVCPLCGVGKGNFSEE